MNAKRDVLRRANVILESCEAALLAEFVEMLYRRATVAAPPAKPLHRNGK